MMKRLFQISAFLLILIITGVSGVSAQDEPLISPKTNMVSLVPLYIIQDGFRVDFDHRISERSWIQLAPAVYFRENNAPTSESRYDFTALKGGGLNIYHRFYPGHGPGHGGVYISYGGVYQYTRIDYTERLMAINYDRFSKIQRIGGDINIGIMAKLSHDVLLDFYTGFGIRHATVQSNADDPRLYNSDYFERGYTGIILNLGFRVGFLW
jgi:hypothetical protein